MAGNLSLYALHLGHSPSDWSRLHFTELEEEYGWKLTVSQNMFFSNKGKSKLYLIIILPFTKCQLWFTSVVWLNGQQIKRKIFRVNKHFAGCLLAKKHCQVQLIAATVRWVSPPLQKTLPGGMFSIQLTMLPKLTLVVKATQCCYIHVLVCVCAKKTKKKFNYVGMLALLF